MTLLRIAWRNLWRAWRRSALVMGAISLGIAACLLLTGWSHGWVTQIVQTAVATRLALLAVHEQGYQADPDVERALDDGGRELVAALERYPGLRASPRVFGDGLAQSARHNEHVALVAVIPEREARISVIGESLVEGGFPEPVAAGAARALPGALIGAALADELKVHLGDKLVLHAPGESGLGAFRVSGLYRSASPDFDKRTVFLRLEDGQRLLGVGDRVHEIAIALDDARRLGPVTEMLRRELPAVRPGESLEILTWKEREPRLAAMLDLMASTAWVGYAAVFAGMVFGIANALLMSVYERFREFGVLRSLGLPSHRLVALVLLESLMLTVGGAALGVASGVLLVAAAGHTGVSVGSFAAVGQLGVGPRVYPRLEAMDWAAPFALAFVTALLAAIWPAVKAARLRPAEAVRHV